MQGRHHAGTHAVVPGSVGRRGAGPGLSRSIMQGGAPHLSALPSSTSRISARMAISAFTKRSSSACTAEILRLEVRQLLHRPQQHPAAPSWLTSGTNSSAHDKRHVPRQGHHQAHCPIPAAHHPHAYSKPLAGLCYCQIAGRLSAAMTPCCGLPHAVRDAGRALDSDSVGSIMSVPATGQDMVGAWKP